MTYKIRRFSYPEGLERGREYISSSIDSGLGTIEDLSTAITEDPRLKDLRPVKRHGKFVRNLTKLLRKDRKEKKQYSNSQNDPTTTINTSEANKFKVSLNRLTSSMGNDSQSLIDS